MASGTVPVLDRAMRIRIRCQQFFHVGEFLVLILDRDRPVVALQTHIKPIREDQSAFLRGVRIVAVHAGSLFRNGRMLDRRCLHVSGDILVALATKPGNSGRQQILVLGHMRRMAIYASSHSGLMGESRVSKLCIHILVTFQAHL